jgi:hypothetical protein
MSFVLIITYVYVITYVCYVIDIMVRVAFGKTQQCRKQRGGGELKCGT